MCPGMQSCGEEWKEPPGEHEELDGVIREGVVVPGRRDETSVWWPAKQVGGLAWLGGCLVA